MKADQSLQHHEGTSLPNSNLEDKDRLARARREMAAKREQLREYVASFDDALESESRVHARTIAEGRILQLDQDMALLSAESPANNVSGPSESARLKAIEDCDVVKAFEAVDDKDWDHLFAMIPLSGHGQFWLKVFGNVRRALSDTPPRSGLPKD